MAGNQHSNTTAEAGRGLGPALLALCVLAAQLVAAVHYHPLVNGEVFSKAAHSVASETGCPVCVLHAHAPVCAAAMPELVQPLLTERFFKHPAIFRKLCAAKPQLFGRAPPATL